MTTDGQSSDRQASAAPLAVPRLLDELRRRNVIRMAGLYLVGAWLLVQVASTLFPTFGVASWALRALVIIVALGFIPAIVFSWVFELTPQGLKRDADVKPEASIAAQTARRMEHHDGGLGRYPPSFRNSPGMKLKLEKMGATAYWRAKVFPKQCYPVGAEDFNCD